MSEVSRYTGRRPHILFIFHHALQVRVVDAHMYIFVTIKRERELYLSYLFVLK